MGTKNNPGKFDCYAKAAPDEPLFILRAKDKHAPALIWLWATLRELDGESPEKVGEARNCVVAMINWAAEHNIQVVGLSQSVIAGVLELIRQANRAVPDGAKNSMTSADVVRRFLTQDEFAKQAEINTSVDTEMANIRRGISAEAKRILAEIQKVIKAEPTRSASELYDKHVCVMELLRQARDVLHEADFFLDDDKMNAGVTAAQHVAAAAKKTPREAELDAAFKERL